MQLLRYTAKTFNNHFYVVILSVPSIEIFRFSHSMKNLKQDVLEMDVIGDGRFGHRCIGKQYIIRT